VNILRSVKVRMKMIFKKILLAILCVCPMCCHDETFEEMNEPEYKVKAAQPSLSYNDSKSKGDYYEASKA